MLILISVVVDVVLNLIISVEEDVDVIVMYILMMMRFTMSMRKDLMIMKILLDTMGILDSHMNIIVVLVMMGKFLVVVAIEVIRIALLV